MDRRDLLVSTTDNEAPRCGAKAKTTGKPCRKPPEPGATRCRIHGGASPRAQAAAQRRLAEAAAQQEIERFGILAPVADPLTALGELAGEVLALKTYFRGQVDRLEQLRYQAGSGEQLRAEVGLYERALDRSMSLLTAMARLNVDDRLARISIAQRSTLVRAVETALAAAGVPEERLAEVRAVIARELRAAEEGGARESVR